MSKEEETRSLPAGATETVGDEGGPFSPGFRSVAVMAGWDEETLLTASLIIDDTPDGQFKQRRRSRSDSGLKTPPSSSRSGKRWRDPRRSPAVIPATVLELGEDGEERKPNSHDMEEKTGPSNRVVESGHKGVVESKAASSSSNLQSQGLPPPSMDLLREELSCAICLEICFEPSTTPCGHSFCRECLKSVAKKCRKRCPKCRQLFSNGRSCSVNTVLWNTIQLLFPDEVEFRKAAKDEKIITSEEPQCHLPEIAASNSARQRSLHAEAVISSELYERRATPSISEVLRFHVPGRGEINIYQRRSPSSMGVVDRDLHEGTRRLSQSQDEDARRRATPSVSEVPRFHVPGRGETNNYRRQSPSSVGVVDRDLHERTRRLIPSQDEDAALAFRLQREELMEAFRETRDATSLSMERANLSDSLPGPSIFG